MKVNFYVRFYTRPGQTLNVVVNIEEPGNAGSSRKVAMEYLNNEFWQASVELDVTVTYLAYKYIFIYEDGFEVIEWGDGKTLHIPSTGVDEIQLVDTWNHAGEYENVFFTSPFQETLLHKGESKSKNKSPKSFTHTFKVKSPLLKKNEAICLCGSGIVLNDWNTSDPLIMSKEGNWWTININLPKEELPLWYKYGVYNLKEKTFVRYEDGTDRFLFGDATKNKLTILHDGFVHLPNNTWRGAGVAIPVFSLKSKDSFGVGEFTDLKLLVDWSKKAGLKLIQILPINDTSATNTWVDSYPYAAISAFALHPIYINLEKIAGKKSTIIKALSKKQKELNDLPEMDYEEVMKTKLSALREIYTEQKESFLADPEFEIFFNKNKHWLMPYAAFSYLKDKNGTSDFSKWKIYNAYNKEAIEKYVSSKARHYDHIAFQYFIQYHLHLQLKEATEYAHKNGIIVKGDIPIGIYRHSCDAWMNPGLYNMDMQAGAPPDGFAVKGQNWGFPTYNWEKMEADGYAWWTQRFDEMSNYFDAFRIDHILGFFRIWSIPIDAVEGIMGRFVPALAIHINEFNERNIWFDANRYTQPFITEEVLDETAGELSSFIRETFLECGSDPDQFKLKEAFNTQRKVETHFAGLEENNHNYRVKNCLFDLISNVVLFEREGPGGTMFDFRIGMENTSSFRNLEWNTQQQLKEVYVNYFFRRQDEFWKREAMHKLPALKASTNMLICGEDLGMVPHCVPDVMRQLGILSLEIQRMPKDSGREFFHPNDAPYLSVVTPSTHDMSTIRGWWEEDRGRTQRFFNHELGQWGDAPYFCETWINKAIVMQHLHSPAMWSIFQLQDLLGMDESLRRQMPDDERINVPSNPRHYWRYRMHITLEQLLREKAFNHEMKEHVEASGR